MGKVLGKNAGLCAYELRVAGWISLQDFIPNNAFETTDSPR